ncbi:hypothetical protein [Arvimicrobium flavum]|uniref:hypothetical protein n=1 Tax=Arvimicrobium flavum TaxID=3393320 RepID=UPI00237A1375|nr:hypothetical protein [Mesorhizobium shangrilense]
MIAPTNFSFQNIATIAFVFLQLLFIVFAPGLLPLEHYWNPDSPELALHCSEPSYRLISSLYAFHFWFGFVIVASTALVICVSIVFHLNFSLFAVLGVLILLPYFTLYFSDLNFGPRSVVRIACRGDYYSFLLVQIIFFSFAFYLAILQARVMFVHLERGRGK